MRKGFTVIELLVVIAILAIIAGLVIPLCYSTTPTEPVQVVEKWSDIDADGNRVLRIRTVSAKGEVETWNSTLVHNNVEIGQWYRLKTTGGVMIRSAKLVTVRTEPDPKQITAVTKSTEKVK